MTDQSAHTITSWWDPARGFVTMALDERNEQVGDTLVSAGAIEASRDVRWLMRDHPLARLDVSRIVARELDRARIIYVEV